MILPQLPKHARVWIYQSNRILTDTESQATQAALDTFVKGWKAHGAALAGGAQVIENRWLVVAVDEMAAGASGCSIDSSVHAIQAIGAKLNIDFFNRTTVWWQEDGAWKSEPMHDFWARRKAGLIHDDTPVFNQLAKSLGELREAFTIPFSESFHAEMW